MVHEKAAFDEWGASLTLKLDPGADQRGLWLALAPVEFGVGYGLVTHEDLGLLTTYGGVSLAGSHSHGVRLGGHIALGEWVDPSVEGERSTQGGTNEHQVALYGHVGW